MRVGDYVEKFVGDYGGPGRIVGIAEPRLDRTRYIVAFKVEGGFGEFYHILTAKQLRPIGSK